MKAILLLVALLALIPASVAAQESSSVSMSIAIPPGPFSATLEFVDGVAELTVDDPTDTGRGWWVTVDCTCRRVQHGELQVLAGDQEHAPHWAGGTLVAAPGEGTGLYRQAFVATAGSWIITSGQGQHP